MVAVMVVVATSLGGIVAGALWGPGLYNTWPFHFGFCPEGCGLCIARGKYRPVESDGDNYDRCPVVTGVYLRSEEQTSELQSLMRKSYAVFCLNNTTTYNSTSPTSTDNITSIHTHPRTHYH